MTTNQIIYYTMVGRTIVIMNLNDSYWKTKLKTKNRVDRIKAILLAIDELAKQQGLSTTGATDTKNDQRLTAAIMTLFVDDILKSYYEDKDDKKSAAIVDFTMTDFAKGAIKNSITNMQLVYDTAAAIELATPLALADYNLKVTDLPEFKTALDSLNDVAPTTSVMRSGNKTVTEDIRLQFALLRKEMTGLDTNVNTYSRTSAKFVADYTNGRRMVQTGLGHKTAEVALMPVHFEAVLGKDYTVGDTLTLRSHSPFKAKFGYSNDPKVLPLKLKDLDGGAEIKDTIELDAEGNFGHWLIIYNPNEFDDVNITVLVAKA